MPNQYAIRSAFNSPADEFNGSGKRPVVFDVYSPDRSRSLLPDNLKMVLHVNPSSMRWSYTNHIERTQTMGGFIEAHWGQQPSEISVEAATGGFVRLYSGLSNTTGVTPSSDQINPKNMVPTSIGGTRRDSIAYDKYLDLLALYYFNGAIYDTYGNIAQQGQILMSYDGGAWWGWFTTFSVEETSEKPYQFQLTFGFSVEREQHRLRGVPVPEPQAPMDGGVPSRTPPGSASNPPPTAAELNSPMRGSSATNRSDPGWQASHADALDAELDDSLAAIRAPDGPPPQQQPGRAPSHHRRHR